MPASDITSRGGGGGPNPDQPYGPRVRTQSLAKRLPSLPTSEMAATASWLRFSFFAMLAFAPLPFGSNRPLWWTVLALWTGGMMAAYAYRIWSGRERPGIGLWALLPIVLPYLAAVLWAIVQTWPIPFDGLAHPIWNDASDALVGKPMSQHISLDPHRTGTGVMRLLTYAGIFWLALQFGRDRVFADRLLKVLTWTGLVYATYGVIVHVFGVERVLWYPKQAYVGFLTSTFINRNSYATYAALGLMCSTAVLFTVLRDSLQRKTLTKRTWMHLIETLTGPGAVPLVATCILGTALLQTVSRAGEVCTMIGLLVFMILTGVARLVAWRHTFVPVFGIVVVTIVLLLINGTNVMSRIQTLNADRIERTQMYEVTANAIGDAPVVGVGLGTFPSIFAMYRQPSYVNTMPVENAHNSYLENALELGLPATILLLGSLGAVLEACIMALKRRKRGRIFPIVGIAAITTVTLHAVVDFSLEIPAVAVTFAAIIGVACAQSFRTSRKSRLKFQVLPESPGEAATNITQFRRASANGSP